MVSLKNEYHLLIQNEEQALPTKNKKLSFHDSSQKRLLLFCCLICVVVSLCLISFYCFQFEFFWKKKQVLYNDKQDIFKNKIKLQHNEKELYKLIGEYEYCDRINGPYIKCLNGGVCVKIDCYILELKNLNDCIQCICPQVSLV